MLLQLTLTRGECSSLTMMPDGNVSVSNGHFPAQNKASHYRCVNFEHAVGAPVSIQTLKEMPAPLVVDHHGRGSSPRTGVAEDKWAVQCTNLIKSYGDDGYLALSDVSLAVRQNEFFTLLGPSGCGKSTLLRAIAGLEVQDAGSICVDGNAMDGLPPYRRPINTVFQNYAVFPHLTVARNIAFGLEMLRRPKSEILQRVEELTKLVKLDGLEARRPHQLSGGQQQRVALARALATRPRILLLDEPLAALDLKLRTQMQLELKRLQSDLEITFIFVTHDQSEALAMSDRIAVMSGGKILQIGSPVEIYEQPNCRFVAEFIGEMNFLEATRIDAQTVGLKSGDVYRFGRDLGSSSATLAIRPERTVVTAVDAGDLNATVVEGIYHGSETSYYLRLSDGSPIHVRQMNSGRDELMPSGTTVGVKLPASSVQVFT